MKIASWNVNSLKVRLRHVLDWLESAEPDVLALQETKLTDDKFPDAEIQELGYNAVHSGQKTYNGVALISKDPATDIRFEGPRLAEGGKRVLIATIGGIRIVNLYVVNGQSVGSEKYTYKLFWLDHIIDELRNELATNEQLVALGDFNIAPQDCDVHDPAAWHESILCSREERAKLEALLSIGLADTYRLFSQPEDSFSWWDYRQGAFRRNRGLRIDLVLASTPLVERCTLAGIDAEPRRLERPSDHAPVYAEFDLP